MKLFVFACALVCCFSCRNTDPTEFFTETVEIKTAFGENRTISLVYIGPQDSEFAEIVPVFFEGIKQGFAERVDELQWLVPLYKWEKKDKSKDKIVFSSLSHVIHGGFILDYYGVSYCDFGNSLISRYDLPGEDAFARGLAMANVIMDAQFIAVYPSPAPEADFLDNAYFGLKSPLLVALILEGSRDNFLKNWKGDWLLESLSGENVVLKLFHYELDRTTDETVKVDDGIRILTPIKNLRQP